MLVPRLADRPWTGEGAVVGVGVPLAAVADLLRVWPSSTATTSCCAPASASARRGCRPTPRRSSRSATASWRSAGTSRRGVCRPALAEVSWPEPDAVSRSLTLAIKQQLDPNGTLAPGRLAEAA